MDITVRQLEIFRAVVVAGSITKASHRIGLSQPSISQQLAKLEDTLNAQLILRNRTGLVSMTPAGEFWFKSSGDLISRMGSMLNEHEQRFRTSNVVLRLGVTPAMRGRFTAAAARIAQAEPGFVKFELIYDVNSSSLVEQLRMQRINFAIVSEPAMASESSSFAISHLFTDRLVWAVPSRVSDADICTALTPDAAPQKVNPALRNFVEIDAVVPTRSTSDDWYRHFLPCATATFSAPTFSSSLELVTAGLATCHIPESHLPCLSLQDRASLRIIALDIFSRPVVLAMRKHLLTHVAYARIFHKLTAFCQQVYAAEMRAYDTQPLAQFLPPEVGPARSGPSPANAKVNPIFSIGNSALT